MFAAASPPDYDGRAVLAGNDPMIVRIVVTLVVLGFAIGAFCGAGPTTVQPSPFGLLFLFAAAFVWFKWERFRAGFSRAVMDDIAQSYWRADGGGSKVPEPDDARPRGRR